jgi:hypothetical protein
LCYDKGTIEDYAADRNLERVKRLRKSGLPEKRETAGTHAPYTRNFLHLVAKIGWQIDEQ